MSDEAAKKLADPKDVKAWSNAIKELYGGIYGDPSGLTSWPKELIFPPLPDLEKTKTAEDEIREGKKLWTWAHTTLQPLAPGYRLGYAIQVLLQIPANPEKAPWEKVKAAISGDKDLRTYLLFLHWVLNKPGMEHDEDAKGLCSKAYSRFFAGKLDNIDKLFGGAYAEVSDDEKTIKRLKHGTPFSMGMKQAAKDLEAGLESPRWKTSKLNEYTLEWGLRYKGITWYDEENRTSEDPTRREQRERRERFENME